MEKIVFLQCQVSQLDEPVYARMHELSPGSVAVVYWNDYGFSRKRIDPEIGVVPDLSEIGVGDYPKTWLDRQIYGAAAAFDAVMASNPKIAVLSDQPQLDRLRLATAFRRRGVKVAFRVDKNSLSEYPRAGASLAFERLLVRRFFDILAPTSPMTTAYYKWPEQRPCVLSPYPTNERKFAPGEQEQAGRRSILRKKLGLGPKDFVFVSATKFSARESPWELIESFATVARSTPHVHLIAIGDGPLLPEIKASCVERGIHRTTFPGFVPFRDLQDYFFAGDAYLHLVAVGPWEVSPQDALIAGLGVLTTDNVGSGKIFLREALSRFLVPFGNRQEIADRMLELASVQDSAAWFAPARRHTKDYTVDSTARRWIEALA